MAGTQWSLEQCFQALNVPISDPQGQRRSLDELLGDEGYRRSLCNYFSDDGMTLYAILNVPAVGDVEAVKAMWANEPESLQSGFKTLSERLCGGEQIMVRSFTGQWVTISSLWQAQDTAAPRRNIVWARIRDDRAKAPSTASPHTYVTWSLDERTEVLGLPAFDFTPVKGPNRQKDWSISPRLLSAFGNASNLYALAMVPTIYTNLKGLKGENAFRKVFIHAWNGLSQITKMQFEDWATQIRAGGAKVLRSVLFEMLPTESLPSSMFRKRNAGGRRQADSPRHEIEVQAIDPTAVDLSQEGDLEEFQDMGETAMASVSYVGPVTRSQTDNMTRLQPQVALTFPPNDHMRPSFGKFDLNQIVGEFQEGKLAELAKLFQTGRDLFDFHVYHVICKLLGQSGDDTETEKLATSIWEEFLPAAERLKWVIALESMQDQCGKGNTAALYKLGLSGSPEGDEDLNMMAKRQIMDHVLPPVARKGYKGTSLTKKSKKDKLYVLDALVTAKELKQDRKGLYKKILAAITEHCIVHGNHTKARTHDGCRIDYDPEVENHSGVSHQLKEVMLMSNSLWDVEVLLRPFAQLHKNTLCQGFNRKMLIRVLRFSPLPRFQTVWCYFGDLHRRITPLRKGSSQDTVRIVVELIRQQCENLHPESILLSKPARNNIRKCGRYSLFTQTEGFGAQISACFDGPERSSAEYEGLVERRLYFFWASHAYAVDPKVAIPHCMQDKSYCKEAKAVVHGMKILSQQRSAPATAETVGQPDENAALKSQAMHTRSDTAWQLKDRINNRAHPDSDFLRFEGDGYEKLSATNDESFGRFPGVEGEAPAKGPQQGQATEAYLSSLPAFHPARLAASVMSGF